MKKTLALLLALALVFSSITVAFADEAISADAKACQSLGMLVGDGSGVTASYLATAPTRIQAAIMVLRLKGLEDDAKAFTGVDNFADAEKAAWAKPIMAYLKANPTVGFAGTGNNAFDPNGTIDAKSYYKVMLETLGYKQTQADVVGDFTWDNLLTVAAEKGLKAVAGTAKFTVNDLATATIETLKVNPKGATKTLAASLVESKVITAEAALAAGLVSNALAVDSIKTASAKSIVVKFNRAVADTDKVTLAVTRSTTPVSTTTTWNTDKTEATLASASNFAEATFTVVVKADDKELSKQDVTFTAQKVAKIEFTSKSVAVNLTATGSSTGGDGYVNYKVYDQYNNDITTHYLANNLTFNVGVGTPSWKNGLLTIQPNANTTLMQYQAISVIAYDTTSGVSATVSLPTSTAVGTLSDFALGSVENVKLVDGDVTTLYYIPFTAKDMSGNETKDYNLIKNGLILQANDQLVVSLNSYVSAKLVQDPNDSRNAAIEVRAISNLTPTVMDMPVTITAMTLTGKTSSVSTTLAKAKVINSITLLAPSATVAVGETPEIGFEAYDQHGNKITRYSEIKGKVSEVGFAITEKVDGSAKFTMSQPTVKGMVTLTSVVSATGKMSTLNINVQDVARPSRLALDTSSVITAMEHQATQKFGLVDSTNGQIAIYDQYDREMSNDDINAALSTGVTLADGTVKHYAVIASATTAQVTVSGVITDATDDVVVTANASTGGSGTIQFTLKDTTSNTILNTASTPIAVIRTSDIVDYTINPITAAIYTANGIYANDSTFTAREKAYAAAPKVYGKTNSGAKVLLASTPIVGASVSNSTDFTVTTPTTTAVAYNAVRVVANKFADAAKTEATTKLTINVFHNNKVTAVSTDIKSSTTAPVSTDIIVEGDFYRGETATVGVANIANIVNKYIVGYTSLDAATDNTDGSTTNDDTSDYFIFKNKDSYGKYAERFGQFVVSKYWDNSASAYVTDPAGIAISADGLLTITNPGNIAAGDSFVITAITKNGLVKSIKVQF